MVLSTINQWGCIPPNQGVAVRQGSYKALETCPPRKELPHSRNIRNVSHGVSTGALRFYEQLQIESLSNNNGNPKIDEMDWCTYLCISQLS